MEERHPGIRPEDEIDIHKLPGRFFKNEQVYYDLQNLVLRGDVEAVSRFQINTQEISIADLLYIPISENDAEMARALINDCGAFDTADDENPNPYLVASVKLNRLAITRLLLDRIQELGIKNKIFYKVYYVCLASDRGFSEMVDLLLEKFKPSLTMVATLSEDGTEYILQQEHQEEEEEDVDERAVLDLNGIVGPSSDVLDELEIPYRDHCAIKCAAVNKHLNIVEKLIQAGADFSFSEHYLLRNALKECNMPLVDLLWKYYGNGNQLVLQLSARENCFPAFQEAYEKLVRYNQLTQTLVDWTFVLAAGGGSTEILDFLRRFNHARSSMNSEESALDLAVRNKQIGTVKRLLEWEHAPLIPQHIVRSAIEYPDLPILKLLVLFGASLEQEFPGFHNVLGKIAQLEHVQTLRYILKHFLPRRGDFDVDATFLVHKAIQGRNIPVLYFLLSHYRVHVWPDTWKSAILSGNVELIDTLIQRSQTIEENHTNVLDIEFLMQEARRDQASFAIEAAISLNKPDLLVHIFDRHLTRAQKNMWMREPEFLEVYAHAFPEGQWGSMISYIEYVPKTAPMWNVFFVGEELFVQTEFFIARPIKEKGMPTTDIVTRKTTRDNEGWRVKRQHLPLFQDDYDDNLTSLDEFQKWEEPPSTPEYMLTSASLGSDVVFLHAVGVGSRAVAILARDNATQVETIYLIPKNETTGFFDIATEKKTPPTTILYRRNVDLSDMESVREAYIFDPPCLVFDTVNTLYLGTEKKFKGLTVSPFWYTTYEFMEKLEKNPDIVAIPIPHASLFFSEADKFYFQTKEIEKRVETVQKHLAFIRVFYEELQQNLQMTELDDEYDDTCFEAAPTASMFGQLFLRKDRYQHRFRMAPSRFSIVRRYDGLDKLFSLQRANYTASSTQPAKLRLELEIELEDSIGVREIRRAHPHPDPNWAVHVKRLYLGRREILKYRRPYSLSLLDWKLAQIQAE